MPSPQDPPLVQESVIVERGFVGSWAADELVLPLGLAVLVVAYVVVLLGRQADSSWRSKRVAAAAKKSAAQFRRTSASP